jgi:anhydro-N-acetylmuramic acid kinase
MKVAGVLSGTSIDGIDVAVIEFEADFKVLGHHSIAYPLEVREAILAVSNAHTHTSTISRLNFLLGELFADAVKQTCEKLGIPLAALNLIGCHGQTIFHEGEPIEYCGYRIASTLQIGEPAIIAKRTGVTTIADFRCDDIAAGGKGAPLVPLLDYRLFHHPEIGRIALNIGGIANITVIPAGASLEQVRAFDTGPGNMVIDALMGRESFDRNGETARRGRVHGELLETLLADAYYRQPPPKTAGREQYGAEFVMAFRHLSREDAVATATELTARTIADAVKGCAGIQEVIVSGGGAHNQFLMERLRALVPQTVKTCADYGVNIDGKEAILFAFLAYESFHGRACNVPSATGACRAVICGKSAVP